MPRKSHQRSNFKSWFLLIFVCAGIILFYKPLVLLGCKTALYRALSKKEGRTISYDKMHWEDNVVVFSGLQVKDPGMELSIDRIEFAPKISFFGFKPIITLVHPQILVFSTDQQMISAGALVHHSRFIEPRWEIKNGVLDLPSGGRFYFTMSPGNEKESIGNFVFSSDPDPLTPAIFSANLALIDGNLQLGFSLQESDLSRLLPLSGLIFKEMPRKWEKAGGEVNIEGLLCLNSSFQLQELHCHGEGNQVVLGAPEMGIEVLCEEFTGAFSYPVDDASSFWGDKLSASIALKNGNCFFGSPLVDEIFEIRDLDGLLHLGPEKEPQLNLNGNFIKQKREISFSCTGIGGLQQDKSFWSKIQLNSMSPITRGMQATLSIDSHQDKNLKVHLQVEEADQHHIDFIRALCRIPGQCAEGRATISATFFAHEGNWHKVTVEKCHLENLRWFFPELKTDLAARQISTDCEITKLPGKKWTLENLHLQFEEGEYLCPQFNLDSLKMNLVVDDRALQPSKVVMRCGNLQGEIVFPGPLGDHLAKMHIHGDGKEAIAFLFQEQPDKIGPIPLDLQIAARKDNAFLSLETVGSISEEAVKGSAVFSFPFSSFPEIPEKLPLFSFKNAKWQFEHLTEKSYAAFLPLILPGIELLGNLSCEAEMNPSAVRLNIAGDEIFIQHSLAQLYLPHVKGNGIEFFYDSASKNWQGEIPLEEGKLNYRDIDLAFENLEGSLKLNAHHLTASSFYAECEGLGLRGEMDFFFEDKEKGHLSLSTTQIAGSVQNLFSVLNRFPSFPRSEIQLDGNFSCAEKGFVINARIGPTETVSEWSFKGHFNGLKSPINHSTAITEGCCDLVFNSKNQRLMIEKARGVWRQADGTLYTVHLKRFDAQFSTNKNLDFALQVTDGKNEFAYLEAKASQMPSLQWEILFNEDTTRVGGTKLNINQCILDEKMKLSVFEMKPILRCQELGDMAAFLQNAGFISRTFSPKNLQDWEFEGTLQARVYIEDINRGISFHAESSDLQIKGTPWPSFRLKAHKIGENWLIEHLEGGGLILRGTLVVDEDDLSCHQFSGIWQGIEFKGSGNLKPDKKHFSCSLESVKGDLATLAQINKLDGLLAWKGNFNANINLFGDLSDPTDPLRLVGEMNFVVDIQAPIAFAAKTKKTIKFTYNKARGLICNEIDLQLKEKITKAAIAGFKAGKLSRLENGNLALEKFQFSLSREMFGQCLDAKILHSSLKDLKWEKNLEGEGDFQIFPKIVIQASLKPGRYGIGDLDFPFEQLQMRYEKNFLDLRGRSQIHEKPLWTVLQVDLNREPYGALKLLDHPKSEGLKFSFHTLNAKVDLESVEGSCYGVQCQMAKNNRCKIPLATVLSGNVKIDGNSICHLLPKSFAERVDVFKIGDGYEWQGDLVLWQETNRGFKITGILTGNEFEFLGYRFHWMQGNIEASPEHVFITDLKIEDVAGTIGIKKIEFGKDEGWHLYMPQILVRNLQPSIMNKIGIGQQAMKPFTIKNFILSDVRCQLKDVSSLEGSGKLTFTNQFKKESSLFDLPLEIIKKIGLDPGLLTPVQGELEIELRGDKFYLLSLQNSFSEGGRSEFYLAPSRELSYIDLDGKMHIDLKMHQDVMLKITEPFTLTIRGTLEKPRYGLQ